MLENRSFQITRVQVGIFTSPVSFHATKMLGGLSAKGWDEVFDGELVTLPIPEGEALEVPRIIIKSKQSDIELHLGPARVDIIKNQMIWGDPINPNTQVELSLKLLDSLWQVSPRNINRIGFILHRGSLVDDPGLELARHFCQDRWLNDALRRPENFELHAHKTYTFEGLGINSWVRFRTGYIRVSEPNDAQLVRERAVVIEQDLNSLAPDNTDAAIPQNTVRAFLLKIPEEAESIFGKYLP